MRLTKLGLPLVSASLIASSAFSFAIAGGYRHVHHGRGLHEAHHRHFGGYRPLYGYYTRHGQYVPGAGVRLIYGPGYVFVPGHGILGEALQHAVEYLHERVPRHPVAADRRPDKVLKLLLQPRSSPRDEARRIAANIAKLPELLRKP